MEINAIGPIARHDPTCWDGVIELTKTIGAFIQQLLRNSGLAKNNPYKSMGFSWMVSNQESETSGLPTRYSAAVCISHGETKL
ncbi:hypothetical protein [Rhizobium laguerreae]|uniref:hypothetical protein n=1 Tax=Rhizobium laguerreae TaxID=1076926 RepID=UPI001442A345|nr:hypothetical protein [Rhizobium laguerreae]MBY3275345.1 hypothetical protein [Rhizobium laguerreae]